MASIGKDRVKLGAIKNRIRLECHKFLDRKNIKNGPVHVGTYRVDVQLTLQQVRSVDPKVQKKIHAEAIKIIGRHSKTVQSSVENLLKITQEQQKKEKQGNKKARNVADQELNKVNSIIAKAQDALGSDLRKGIETLLKKEGVKGRAASVGRNFFAKLMFKQDTFQEKADESLSDSSVKSWQRIAKGGIVAVTDRHMNIKRETGYRIEATKSLEKLLGRQGSETDVQAAQKCLKTHCMHSTDLITLIDVIDKGSQVMSKQLRKDKKGMNAKMVRQFTKQIKQLGKAQKRLSKTLEEGRKVGEDFMGLLDRPEGKQELLRHKKQITTYARGSDEVKAWASKSARPAKTLQKLIKTVAKKKRRRR